MNRFFSLIAAVVLVSFAGCTLITDVEDPEQLRSRAQTLRTRAAGLERRAHRYDLLVEKSREQKDRYETRLAALREQRETLDERIQELKLERRNLSPAERARQKVTLENYIDERDAVQATIDEQMNRIKLLEDHIEEQSWLKRASLQEAREQKKRADRLEEYASQREQTG